VYALQILQHSVQIPQKWCLPSKSSLFHVGYWRFSQYQIYSSLNFEK
jgi:hypothetical protein